MNEKLSEEYI